LEWERHQKTDYNCFQIDSAGTILATTLKQSGFVDNVVGFNVRDVLTESEYQYFMRSVGMALKRHKITVVDYHLQDQLYTAIIDPIDSETFFLHEIRTCGQDKARIVAILMGWVQRRAG